MAIVLIAIASMNAASPDARAQTAGTTPVRTDQSRALPKFRNASPETRGRLRKIADSIEEHLQNHCVGYSFVVAYGDDPSLTEARAGGMARRAPDTNPRAMRLDDRLSIASVSKMMTAITLLKLLDEKRISPDASISPYLPRGMDQHASIAGITFRQLLTHRSGLRDQGEPSYSVLASLLHKGVRTTDKAFLYQNSNFGIMRLLIPTIEDGFAPLSSTEDSEKSYLYGIHLMAATQKRVFTPLGISTVFCGNPAPDKCLSYQFPQPIQAGQDWGDMTATNAYRGWVLSSDEMSRVIRGLLYTEKLLPPDLRETMLADSLGIWQANVGVLHEFGHNGRHPGNPVPGKMNRGEVNAVVCGYSNGISVAMLVNSQIGADDDPDKVIRAAIVEDLAVQVKK